MTPPAHALLAPAACDDAVFRPADILFGEGDNAPRWREGERLEHLFEDMCDRLAAEGRADAPAVEVDGVPIGFDELDARANRLARHLIAEGVGPDDVVALLFDRSAETYVALLAVLKAGAAYVPLDPGFPPDRIAFICADAGARAALTVEHHLALLEDVPLPRIALDREAAAISQHPAARLTEAERGPQRGDLAYLIYTSGTTGRPKGVAIAHPSIVNFVRVAAETYGYRPGDRVYQGLTLAFDFSVEEIWVPLLAGATLVPNNGEVSLVGEDLWRFLDTRRITALCCVPTLLATVEDDLPQLRLVILSGEACPQDLARRWSREDRRILNAYGPTETTVTATLAVIEPGARVTIGRPLPSYMIAIFDPETGQSLPRGETGEIMIGGIGLARGYLGRDELTAKAFVPDTLGLPHNPSGRLYRSGDLGRINEEGTIDYLGRIDTQVKIRGYRIELTEIESVLMQIPGIAQAVVEKFEPEPGQTELVAYYTEAGGTEAAQEGIKPDTVAAFLRERLPSYMVPAFYECLETMPMLPSDKADRKALPRPSGRRLNGGNAAFVAPGTPLEADLAGLLARVLKLETLSVEDDFFNDLGASSLVMARFSALIRRETGISDFSMRDMYGAPSIRKLATLLEACSGGREPLRRAEDTHEPSYLAYYGCGLAQIGFAVAYALAMAAVLSRGLDWTLSAEGFVETYLRGTLALGAQFAVLCLAPVALKWLLIGRWQAEVIPAWSARYLRFWIVRTLTRAHPLAALPGTPLYSVFLRAMGAKIGASALVQSAPPVCMDLIEIGPGAVVGRKALLQGYKAVDGRIVTGSVRIGTGAHVGEGAVLDIDTEIGDGAQLGHASSLVEGQKLEAGTRAHGSPAVHTATDFRRVGERGTPAPLRRTLYGAGQLATLLLIPPAILTLGLRLMALASANSSIDDLALHATTLQAMPELLFYSSVLFFGGLVLGLAVVLVLPRMAWLFLEADRDYPLFGVRHFLLQVIDLSSNSRFFNLMFGDSVLITGYLRALGYRFGGLFQTGSNFGVQQRHDVPFLCSFGKGTMVSDNLTMANAEFSATQFRLGHVRFGEDNFLGNTLIYPAGGRTGDNVLIGTKTMIPIDGPLRENTGLLGSPAFPIPRSVLRDKQFDAYTDETLRQERLALKTRYNLGTLGVFLLVRWGLIFGSLSVAHAVYFDTMLSGTAGIAVSGMAVALFALVYGIFCERAAFGFRRMSAQFCSIYDRYFWTHERFWKMNISSVLLMLDGTPFKAWALRALGVRVGRKLFDDGASMPEKTLVSIGDCCTLNHQATMQAHSLEDGAFKSDFITIGNRVTLGVNAFVHYSARVGDNALIEADSFLMKGEAPAANSVWRGNPATEVQVPAPVVQLEDRRSASMPPMAAAVSAAGSAAVVAAE